MDVEQYWETKKEELLSGINEAIEKGNVDKDTLELMKELVKTAKLNNSISTYYENQE